MMTTQKGVTLIEMLIVIAIIGTITAIAYPSYQNHVLKSHRNKAMADLVMIQLNIEENKTKGIAYPSSGSVSASICSECDNSGERYSYTITSTSTNYTLTASKTSLQSADTCANLILKSTGEVTTSSNQVDCWK